jgi:hypothetical protein
MTNFNKTAVADQLLDSKGLTCRSVLSISKTTFPKDVEAPERFLQATTDVPPFWMAHAPTPSRL